MDDLANGESFKEIFRRKRQIVAEEAITTVEKRADRFWWTTCLTLLVAAILGIWKASYGAAYGPNASIPAFVYLVFWSCCGVATICFVVAKLLERQRSALVAKMKQEGLQ